MPKSTTKAKGIKKQTPLMTQYFDIKSKYKDAIVLFRVGDFYETFSEDAIIVSKVLGIVLTKRNNGGSNIELAGFPYHSVDLYLPKIVKAGYRVAICEQLEKPSKEKKIVKRGVTDLVTPGVTIDDPLLSNKRNNYLAALFAPNNSNWGIAFLDISTGEFVVSEGSVNYILQLIQSFAPSEIIHCRTSKESVEAHLHGQYYCYALDPWVFTQDYSEEQLLKHFDVVSLKGFGIDDLDYGKVAAGSALHYIGSTEKTNINHINTISRIHRSEFMWMDKFTIRNLEILHSNHESGRPLVDVVDHTLTSMGSRMIRKWLVFPLINIEAINKRHEIVAALYEADEFRDELREKLKELSDIERISSKIPLRRINPREVYQLSQTLEKIQDIKQNLQKAKIEAVVDISNEIIDAKKLFKKINQSIQSDPPVNIQKGNVIQEGLNAELDELRHTIKNSKELLIEIQVKEAEQTGINSLKIGFNNVFGYYLEVTNKYKNLGLVPDHWVRKQTLTGSERYITDELKELETKILGAEEKILNLEIQLFEALIEDMEKQLPLIQKNAKAIAKLDVLVSFAWIAERYNYQRPKMHKALSLEIKNGRHPVIEQQLDPGEDYVPNDLFLDNDNQQIIIITGPNMSGKSAILRQTALITLLAQAGSFVPASEANLSVVDRLFTRVGASDNISSGESTFMVEMNETSSILNNITEQSLILLDEIGRGTSTYDGISIAWSIAEFLHENDIASPKTLFATHYHELNKLEKQYNRIKNFHVATKEKAQKVIFLRKLMPGGSNSSFGIHVAKMAGMPNSIVQRANEILKELEEKKILDYEGEISGPSQNFQLNIFDNSDEQAIKVKELIEGLDINAMTPIECMLKLISLKKELDQNA